MSWVLVIFLSFLSHSFFAELFLDLIHGRIQKIELGASQGSGQWCEEVQILIRTERQDQDHSLQDQDRTLWNLLLYYI